MNEIKIRIPYADTDQMGMVYYANYLIYFERGRTEWLRGHGLEYKKMEKKGMYFPVIESYCKYHSPAKYDDEITVRTIVSEMGVASVEFSYEILCNSKVLTTGRTKHPLVNKDMRPIKIPREIVDIFNKEKSEAINAERKS
ncbi:acyl-CoA thioesterase [Elusimicrobiota bacterium]